MDRIDFLIDDIDIIKWFSIKTYKCEKIILRASLLHTSTRQINIISEDFM